MKEAGQDTGVAPAKDSSTGWVVIWGIILLMFGHVGHCPVNADPLSGSQTATSGAGIPTSWSGRSGSPLTEQIMMRHVYEQIRSLKFAYEENINQLIRKVDTIDMKITRHSCDYNGIETLVRKIESLDIKVNRLETSNVHRLEELSKTIHTKGIRQELAMDGLVQKVDENHERIKQKLIFSEKRLDTINSKMQVYETSFTRIESRLTDIDNEISDISNTLDDIKSLSTFIDDKHNNTQRTMKEQLQAIKSESASRQQLEELSSSVKDIGSRLNDTAPMVRDDETVRLLSSDADRTLMMDLKAQINFESMKIEDKITSMYNNLWSRFMSLETTAKHLLKIGNITRRQLREDFQSLLQSEARFVEPESQENYMNLILDVLKRMLQEHKEQMDSNLQMSMTSQNIFIDSLNKSLHQSNRNEELKEMEITLSSILEKIIYTITNKTSRMDSRVVEMMQMIKEYRTQMMRSLSHLTKMVISLTEKNKEDRERFEKAMLDLTKMNEVIAFGIHDLYQKFEIIMNMTPSCEETTKTSASNQTKGNESMESIETKNPDNTDQSENLETEKVQENGIKIENDDVVKIYSENGSNIEHTNASYQVLNTTNSTQNNDTTTKKQISIVIPYEAIEDEEELKTRLQDFLSQLPVSRTEAIILTNTKKKNTDSRKTMEANREENSKNIGNSEQTIHIALNDGITGNSTHKDNITTNTENKDERKNESFQEIYKLPTSDNKNSTHDPVTKDTENKKLTDLDSKIDGIHDIPSSIEESKTSARENNEEKLQNGEGKRIYDFDGNEDIERSMEEPTKEKNLNEDLENMGNEDSLETTGTREVKHEEIIKTSTIRNEIFLKFPIFSIENEENITTEPKQSSQLVTQSYSLGNTTDIDNKTGVNQTHSLLKWMLVRERLFGKQERNSTSSTESATSSNLSTPKNKSIIETTTKQNLDDKSTPQRRTRQDIKQLFEDMKVRRMLRIQELENVGKESEMFLKEFEDELPFSDDDTPLARRDTSEHFRPITSSEEMTIHEPQFDLLYDEQQLPYSS